MVKVTLKKLLNGANGEMLLDVDFEIIEGDFVMIYGESGAGKTTLLRMLAGLTKPDDGFVEVNRKLWYDAKTKTFLKSQSRTISYMSQSEVLFPNMTVRQNLLFALEKGQDESIVEELIDVIEMQNLKNAKPNLLSGGQKQRVALARALIRNCELLLLDEPLSALDSTMKNKLQDYILKRYHTEKMTVVMVSHHVSEVIKMANTVFMMRNGKIVDEDRSDNLFCKEAGSALQLSGEVISVLQQKDGNFIVVLVGKQQLKLPVEPEQMRNFKIGETIVVNSNSFYISDNKG